MRIWIINHYAIPPTNAGGTRHYNYALQLKKRGHDVLIIAANYNHFTQTFMTNQASVDGIDTSHAVPFIWLPVPAYQGNSFSRLWNTLVFSRALLKNKSLRKLPAPDVIIGSSPHLFAAFGAALLAKRLKCPFILEIRDLWPESLVALGRFTAHHPLIKIMKWIEGYLYKQAARIISLLPNANQYLIQQGVNPENILWLPNAVDVASVATDFVKPFHEKFTIINAGAHGLANDLDTVLAAAKILQDKGLSNKIRICLLGEGPEKARLKETAKQSNLTMVEFWDAVPKNQVYTLLNQADAFLMLLKKSPVFQWGISPNKLFDYLVMGRPVIFGVETPFNPIAQYQAGLSIQASNPEALAAAIVQLASLAPTELNKMGLRGKEYVLQHHDTQQLTASLENLLVTVHSIYYGLSHFQ